VVKLSQAVIVQMNIDKLFSGLSIVCFVLMADEAHGGVHGDI